LLICLLSWHDGPHRLVPLIDLLWQLGRLDLLVFADYLQLYLQVCVKRLIRGLEIEDAETAEGTTELTTEKETEKTTEKMIDTEQVA